MRGTAARQATMLTAVTPDALVPQGHPIRKIKPIVEAALVKPPAWYVCTSNAQRGGRCMESIRGR